MKVSIQFGFLVPKLKAQLAKQGLRFKRGHSSYDKTWWQFNEAISTLGLAGIITEAQKDAARRRVVKRTLQHIELRRPSHPGAPDDGR